MRASKNSLVGAWVGHYQYIIKKVYPVLALLKLSSTDMLIKQLVIEKFVYCTVSLYFMSKVSAKEGFRKLHLQTVKVHTKL